MTTASVSEAAALDGQRGWYKRNEIAITPWLFLAPVNATDVASAASDALYMERMVVLPKVPP